MGRRRDLSGLPEMPQGMTMSEVAAIMTQRLGRRVVPQDVYGQCVRRKKIDTGRATRTVTRQVETTVLVISQRHLDAIEEELRKLDRAPSAG